MEKNVVAVFDGKVFVPVEPVDLPIGERVLVTATVPRQATEQEKTEAAEILRGDGTPLPWETVEEALGRPRYER
jgi:predicted DNA-binding antitoxin AbrB/MazE fold protein